METEKIKRIDSFLSNHKTSYDRLPKNQAQQLLIVDDVVQAKVKHINEAKDFLRKNHFNITDVAEESNISRRTFYNNEFLRLYVEYYDSLFANISIDNKEECNLLKEQIEQLEEKNRKLLLRDILFENLAHELEYTQNELARAVKVNEDLKKNYERIIAQSNQTFDNRGHAILLPLEGKMGEYIRNKKTHTKD